MHRALVGDFEKPLARLPIKLAVEADDAIDPIEHPVLGFVIGAVGGIDSAVAEPHPRAFERQLLAVGVQPQRHRRAGAECSEQQIVGPGAAAEPARGDRLVGQEAMPAGGDFLLKRAVPRFAHDDLARLGLGNGLL